MANWTAEQQPFGQNRAPALAALASDGSGVIPLAADKTTGRLLVNATGSSGGTSSTFGATFPTTGTAVGASDGTLMQPLLVDGSGNLKVAVISGGGGGTQYTDGGVPPTHPIGTMPIWNNGGTWSQTSASAPLPVTANAGTNLNTSALATSANLTAGTQKTQIVDGSGNVIASTSNALNVDITNTSIAVTESGAWNVGSSSATGSPVPANAFYMGVDSGAGTLVGIQDATIGDGVKQNLLAAGIYNFDGTNFNRTRSATAAAGTTGIGLLGSGLLGYDGTNWQYAGIDSSHNLKVDLATAIPAGTNQIGTVTLNTSSQPPSSINNASVAGNDITTVAPGVQLVAQAGPTGDPLGSTGDALNVAVAPGAQLGAGTAARGAQVYFNSALTATTLVKPAALNLYGYHIYNPNSVVIYVQFFNNNNQNSIILGTTAMCLVIPPNGWADAPPGGVPISFSQGLFVVATQTLTALLAPTGLVVNLWYA